MAEQLKPQKTKELTDEEMLAKANELPEIPSFYKFRKAAEIMMRHEFFPKPPTSMKFKSPEDMKEWQRDELALRLEHCKVSGIPSTMANLLYPSNGTYAEAIGIMEWKVNTRAPDAEFRCLKSDAVECIIIGRRDKTNPKSEWVKFRYTYDDAVAQGLVKEKNIHWKVNRQNMINKNNYANAMRGLCRLETGNAYIPEEMPDTEIPFDENELAIKPTFPSQVSKPTKEEIVQSETKSNPATSQPAKKLDLPPHADGMPAMPTKPAPSGQNKIDMPAPMDHPKVETKIIPAESKELAEAKQKAIDNFVETQSIDQSAEDQPENPFEDDMGEADLKALADDKPAEQPKMIMTVDELIANAGHTTVKSKAGKDVDAITFIFKDGSMFDLGDNGKSWKVIGPNGKSVFVAKSISDYNPDLKVLAVPVWCMTMKAEDKAKWQELLEAKN